MKRDYISSVHFYGRIWVATAIAMFLMVPIASVIYTLIREYTSKRLQNKDVDPQKLIEQPPELHSHFVMKAKNAKKKAQARRDIRVERREERREERKGKKNKEISE